MSLDHKKVKEIAYLARLNIEDKDIERATAELNNILSLMDKLGEIDTGDYEPMAHPLKMSQRLREDKVSEIDLYRSWEQSLEILQKYHLPTPCPLLIVVTFLRGEP